jgi:adenylate kinase
MPRKGIPNLREIDCIRRPRRASEIGAMIRSLTALAISAALAASAGLAQGPPARVVLLVGPPGSGKTTQSGFLAKKYGIPAISMADLLKKQMAAQKKDPVTKALAASIASGEMLPDQAAADLIKLRLQQADHSKGFILDGFPATAGQAKALDRILQDEHLPKAVVVVLDVPDDVIRKRMLSRGRADDKPENIDRRIREFREQASLLAGWAGQTQLVRVDGAAGIADVSKRIVAGLEEAWAKQTADRQR